MHQFVDWFGIPEISLIVQVIEVTFQLHLLLSFHGTRGLLKRRLAASVPGVHNGKTCCSGVAKWLAR